MTAIFRANVTLSSGVQKIVAPGVFNGVLLGLDVRWIGVTRDATQTRWLNAGMFFEIFDGNGSRFVTNVGGAGQNRVLISSGERWDWASADLGEFYGVDSFNQGDMRLGGNPTPPVTGFFRNGITIRADAEIAAVPHSLAVGIEYYRFKQ